MGQGTVHMSPVPLFYLGTRGGGRGGKLYMPELSTPLLYFGYWEKGGGGAKDEFVACRSSAPLALFGSWAGKGTRKGGGGKKARCPPPLLFGYWGSPFVGPTMCCWERRGKGKGERRRGLTCLWRAKSAFRVPVSPPPSDIWGKERGKRKKSKNCSLVPFVGPMAPSTQLATVFKNQKRGKKKRKREKEKFTHQSALGEVLLGYSHLTTPNNKTTTRRKKKTRGQADNWVGAGSTTRSNPIVTVGDICESTFSYALTTPQRTKRGKEKGKGPSVGPPVATLPTLKYTTESMDLTWHGRCAPCSKGAEGGEKKERGEKREGGGKGTCFPQCCLPRRPFKVGDSMVCWPGPE